jgi:hypothetical protein
MKIFLLNFSKKISSINMDTLPWGPWPYDLNESLFNIGHLEMADSGSVDRLSVVKFVAFTSGAKQSSSRKPLKLKKNLTM